MCVDIVLGSYQEICIQSVPTSQQTCPRSDVPSPEPRFPIPRSHAVSGTEPQARSPSHSDSISAGGIAANNHMLHWITTENYVYMQCSLSNPDSLK